MFLEWAPWREMSMPRNQTPTHRGADRGARPGRGIVHRVEPALVVPSGIPWQPGMRCLRPTGSPGGALAAVMMSRANLACPSKILNEWSWSCAPRRNRLVFRCHDTLLRGARNSTFFDFGDTSLGRNWDLCWCPVQKYDGVKVIRGAVAKLRGAAPGAPPIAALLGVLVVARKAGPGVEADVSADVGGSPTAGPSSCDFSANSPGTGPTRTSGVSSAPSRGLAPPSRKLLQDCPVLSGHASCGWSYPQFRECAL